VDCWSIGKDLSRETIIKLFEFYSSFDKFAFSFEKIDSCSFGAELFVQIWKENRSHTTRKEACLQKLKEKTEILDNNEKNRFKYISRSLKFGGNLDQRQQNYRKKEVKTKFEYIFLNQLIIVLKRNIKNMIIVRHLNGQIIIIVKEKRKNIIKT
jgi:hypothetical protein